MVKRSSVLGLPTEVKAWLDKSLVTGNFTEYQALADELKGRGYDIAKSSVHRYGQQLENRLAAIKASTEAAELIVAAAPDHADARSEAILGLIQTEMFDAILKLQELEGQDANDRVKTLAGVSKSVATMVRASVNQKKWRTEMEATIREEERTKAAEAAMAAAKESGASQATVTKIREALGIPT